MKKHIAPQLGKITESDFLNPPAKVSKKQLLAYCRMWWLVQPEISFGLGVLAGRVANQALEALRSGSEKEEVLRNISRIQTSIAADELGVAGKDTVMRDELFKRQTIDAGISWEKVTAVHNSLAHPVKDLLHSLHQKLCGSQMLSKSLSMVYVMEALRPELLATQHAIFSHAGIPDSKLSLLHIYKAAEKGTLRRTGLLYDSLVDLVNQHAIDMNIEDCEYVWKDFLDEIAAVVYK